MSNIILVVRKISGNLKKNVINLKMEKIKKWHQKKSTHSVDKLNKIEIFKKIMHTERRSTFESMIM